MISSLSARRRWLPAILLVVLIATVLVLDLKWIASTNYLGGKDYLQHLSNFACFEEKIQSEHRLLEDFFLIHQDYPPLLYWSMHLTGVLGGSWQPKGLIRCFTFFFLLLTVAVFLIGRKLRDSWTGLVAAYLVASCPAFLFRSHMVSIDLAHAALIAICLLFLYHADRFRSWRYSLLLGLSTGLAFLLNQKTFIFLMAPLLFEGVMWLRDSALPAIARRQWRLVATAALPLVCFFTPAILLPLPYYRISHSSYSHRWNLLEGEFYHGEGQQSFLRFALFYVHGLFQYELSWLHAVALIGGFVGLFWWWRTRAGKRLTLWFLVPVIMLTAFPVRYICYIVPALAATFLHAALWLTGIRFQILRRVAIACVLSGSMIAIFTNSFPWAPWLPTFLPAHLFPEYPTREKVHQDRLAALLSSLQGERSTVALISERTADTAITEQIAISAMNSRIVRCKFSAFPNTLVLTHQTKGHSSPRQIMLKRLEPGRLNDPLFLQQQLDAWDMVFLWTSDRVTDRNHQRPAKDLRPTLLSVLERSGWLSLAEFPVNLRQQISAAASRLVLQQTLQLDNQKHILVYRR